ncbi:hypothetical protein NBEOAGPD_4828 [Methylobacterium gregans]|uniref:Uncharacterized protein n=2 Tax=Methylobacterium gregans TaxID=374424 RepID=A0AA37HTV9_9HYPH|nr:hypothetical protein [Methylobacterium gregans]MDQ0521371.1 hypothetical protein [Methylobacterium gregans]GJD81575.1 hypothetical protein NBEOAGPD_4828 [Methylobacterium gregans]
MSRPAKRPLGKRTLGQRLARPLPLGLAGLAALALAVLAAGWREAAGAYLAAWLVLLGLAAGALPVAVALERFGLSAHDRGEGEIALSLRRLLGLMPAAAILGLPLLAAAPLLYPWADAPPDTPLGRLWFTLPGFCLRVVAYLGLWVWLAARFRDAPLGPRDGRTAAGVGLHAVVGTLAVTDLVGSLDPRLGSSLEGLLVLTAWSGLAFAAAILRAPEEPAPVGRGRAAAGRDRLVPLAVLLALWAYLHFVQFLIVWSANLPDEVRWYFARGGWAGRGLALMAGAAVLAAALATLRPGRPTTRVLAGLVVVLHAVEMFWLVTPALRDRFTLTAGDLLAALGILCLATALRPLARMPHPRGPKSTRETGTSEAGRRVPA